MELSACRRLISSVALVLGLSVTAQTSLAQGAKPELLVYCGITMVRPMTEIAQNMEKKEGIKVTLAQGGSEDLYQSLKKSGVGDLYLPGEPTYREKYLKEGLLGEFQVVGYNQMALMVQKGNPKKVKGNPRELLRSDLTVMIGNSSSGSVGKETKDILDSLGLYTKVVDSAVSLAPDSRSLANAMKKKEVDLIMNWRATGYFPDNAPAMDVIDLDAKVAVPQALLLNLITFSKNKDLARKFIAYAAGEEGQAIFRKFGFLDNKAVVK